MGVLADLIVAEMADAQAILASDYPLEKFKGSNADGLDPLMLAELHGLLAEHQPHELLPAYRPIAQASDQGPWLIRLPSEMVQRLADLPPQDHPSVAARWAAEERMREHAPGEHWADQILEIAALQSQMAAFEGKELFLILYD